MNRIANFIENTISTLCGYPDKKIDVVCGNCRAGNTSHGCECHIKRLAYGICALYTSGKSYSKQYPKPKNLLVIAIHLISVNGKMAETVREMIAFAKDSYKLTTGFIKLESETELLWAIHPSIIDATIFVSLILLAKNVASTDPIRTFVAKEISYQKERILKEDDEMRLQKQAKEERKEENKSNASIDKGNTTTKKDHQEIKKKQTKHANHHRDKLQREREEYEKRCLEVARLKAQMEAKKAQKKKSKK